MGQVTAKTVADVLEWIETTPHHIASTIEEPGFFVLRGYGCKLRIPIAVHAQTKGLVKPGKRFDTRMYRATIPGRLRLLAASCRAPT